MRSHDHYAIPFAIYHMSLRNYRGMPIQIFRKLDGAFRISGLATRRPNCVRFSNLMAGGVDREFRKSQKSEKRNRTLTVGQSTFFRHSTII